MLVIHVAPVHHIINNVVLRLPTARGNRSWLVCILSRLPRQDHVLTSVAGDCVLERLLLRILQVYHLLLLLLEIHLVLWAILYLFGYASTAAAAGDRRARSSVAVR